MPIDMKPVTSSQIASVGYDAGTKTLAIKFHGSGGTYHYSDVSPEQHDALVKADSIGRHFGRHVKGQFKFTRVGAGD